MAPHGHALCLPPFSVFYCPLLSLPPQASPCADPQDHKPSSAAAGFFFFCDLLPQVWKETLSAGVGRLGRPSPGWSERGHRVSKAEDMRSPSLQQGVIRTPSRLKMSLSTSGAPHPSQRALAPWGVGWDWISSSSLSCAQCLPTLVRT